MSAKQKQDIHPKVPTLKGQEAEDRVLEYFRQMNRPYGSVDVSANLKGAIPKAAVQRILTTLAEKGELTQKIYGKATFFVYNQAKQPTIPNVKIHEVNNELTKLHEENQRLLTEFKALSAELVKIKATSTDMDIDTEIHALKDKISQVAGSLQAIQSGSPLIPVAEREKVYEDWSKWRDEWVRRRKIFCAFWKLVVDPLTPQDAKSLEEHLGIELDTSEHAALEQAALCQQNHKF